MSPPTHTDIHRDLGRMEGRLDAMEDRLGKVEVILARIDGRLARIEARENERKGAWWMLVFVTAVVTTLAGWLINHFWK